ncbi:DUF6524 family protein [Yoonia sp.]|uniref:DUF6524 family protein n=1 Tax=Yoonia sp. TaxID=2212373 RepID=UPI0039191923
MRFVIRWIFAFALLAATYNPTGRDFWRWGPAQYESQPALVVILGVVLLVGFILFIRATLRSIGLYGFALGLAVIGTIIWLASDQGLITLQDRALTTWLILLGVALMLAIGQSWAQVRDRLAAPDTPDE